MYDAATELEAMKRIDLRAYAASVGYQEDRRDSSQGSTCMRHPETDDKIFVKLDGGDGHYCYFSVRDDLDHGSIMDFVMVRERVSLGAARKVLRPWLSQSQHVAVPAFSPLPKTAKDRIGVEIEYAKTQDALRHAYLENERGLPPGLLASARFAGRVRVDRSRYGNAIFPHFDQQDQQRVCGYEIKNRNFTGFSAGGSKGLWFSQVGPEDNRLVFCESAIDALSHAALFPDDRARYASIGGKLNPQQPELIRAAVERMPVGSEIVAAMDADADGAKLAGVVRGAVELSGRDDLRFVVHEPLGFKDWNDQLRKKPNLSFPTAPLPLPKVG